MANNRREPARTPIETIARRFGFALEAVTARGILIFRHKSGVAAYIQQKTASRRTLKTVERFFKRARVAERHSNV